MMEHLEFGDEELEGDPSAEWWLRKVVATGMAPTARHRAWVADASIPAGDRSVHEHHVIMKIIESAARRDQLNLMVLESFELLIRRAQVIEKAHSLNPSNPDYGHAEDYMGWGVQRGGALIAPGLSRHAANKAAERTSVLKEQRKWNEEVRLRRSKKPSKGKGKGEEEDGAGQ